MEDVKQVPAFKEVQFVQNPSLIKVSVLKVKFLEQMPKLLARVGRTTTNIELPEHSVIGLAQGFEVVVLTVEQKICKVHGSDYAVYLAQSEDLDRLQEANCRINKFPQLFTE